MKEELKKVFKLLFDPPWTKDGPDNFTLAVPEAHSTFKRGDTGWANRPPAVVECPQCSSSFTQEFANDYIKCPDCHHELPPDDFAVVSLRALICPHCQQELEHGIRHPSMLDVPEWASCTNCQYHWEYLHNY